AAAEVGAGRWREHFPLPVLQGGGGTATNMNLNEVLANLAEERLGGRRGDYLLVDPLDHVNRSQSTNDTYPTALNIVSIRLTTEAVAGLGILADRFEEQAAEYAETIERPPRTCKQDALPVGMRATHSTHAEA